MSRKAKMAGAIVAACLAAGIVVGVALKTRGDPRGPGGSSTSTSPRGAAADPAEPGGRRPAPRVAENAAMPDSKVIAYYFHRTVRCHTCLAIEDLSRQTIESVFGEQLAEGRIEWRPVNIEQKGNEHFEDDFELKNQSLVLVKLEGGKQADWKNLTSVWDLIQDHEKFVQYVREETSKYLRP